jgi:hypothetical protein
MGYQDRLDRNRKAAYALTPYRDRAKDKFKAFLLKVSLLAVLVLVIVIISMNTAPPQ